MNKRLRLVNRVSCLISNENKVIYIYICKFNTQIAEICDQSGH